MLKRIQEKRTRKKSSRASLRHTQWWETPRSVQSMTNWYLENLREVTFRIKMRMITGRTGRMENKTAKEWRTSLESSRRESRRDSKTIRTIKTLSIGIIITERRVRRGSIYSEGRGSKIWIRSMGPTTISMKKEQMKRIKISTLNIGNAIMKNIGIPKRIMLTISNRLQQGLGSSWRR
jgi:hypothetical protein